MKTIEALHRSGVAVSPDTTIRAAAGLMEHAGVGSLAIVDGERLIGIVTDRDIVRRAVARGVPADGRIDSVMTTDLVTVDVGADVHSVYGLLREHAVRRIPVVRGNRFVGMITMDDLLIELASDLADLARPITAEALFSHREMPLPSNA
jgi:CBS domain-containing protein